MHIIIIRYLAKIWLCGKMYVFCNIAGVAERHAYNYYPVSDQIFVLRLLAMIGFFSVTFHFVKIRSVLYAHLAWYSLRLWDSHLKKSNILAKLNAEMEIFRSSIATHPASYSVYLWDCPFNKPNILHNSPPKWKCSGAASPHTSLDILYAIETDPLINKSNIYRKSPSKWKCSGAASPNNSHDTLYACETVPLINQTSTESHRQNGNVPELHRHTPRMTLCRFVRLTL